MSFDTRWPSPGAPTFDVIMMHHSLEHMPDIRGSMRDVRRWLSPTGIAVVRVPLATYAWKHYGLYATKRGRPRSRAALGASHSTPQWSNNRSR